MLQEYLIGVEERLDKKYPYLLPALKDFILSELFLALQSDRQRLIEEVEKMPNKFPERESDEYDAGYQTALDSVLSLLKE